MTDYDLSILIPARNEEWLAKTVKNILENIRGKTEIIVVLDGAWANPPIDQDPRVTVLYHPESVGQREGTNDACRLSRAKYVAKLDAHCAFDEGFDIKMMDKMQDNWVMVPIMKHLHVFDWKCDVCGSQWDQGATPEICYLRHGKNGKGRVPNPGCDNKTKFSRIEFWEGRKSPKNRSYCFDSEPHFQYFNEYRKRDEYKSVVKKNKLTESMSIQGSFFMITREKYWELKICDSDYFPSWGSQGIEVACKIWLSGGKVMINHDTWYAHLFRTQGGDFSFPYKQLQTQVNRAKKDAKKLFFYNKWKKQIYPLSWLVEKFWPIKGWSDEDLIELKKNDVDFIPNCTP
jgi:glycosyltransferase involved in cell wall biosynthesis